MVTGVLLVCFIFLVVCFVNYLIDEPSHTESYRLKMVCWSLVLLVLVILAILKVNDTIYFRGWN